MFGGAYKQFGNQFLDDPSGDGLLYRRLTFATQQRTGFGPVRISQAEGDRFYASFKRTVRVLVTLFAIAFVFLVIALASVPGIDAPGDGSAGPPASGAVVGGYVAAMVVLLVLLGVGCAWAWRRPARVLADRPVVSPDPVAPAVE